MCLHQDVRDGGFALEVGMHFCPNCGTSIAEGASAAPADGSLKRFDSQCRASAGEASTAGAPAHAVGLFEAKGNLVCAQTAADFQGHGSLSQGNLQQRQALPIVRPTQAATHRQAIESGDNL